MYTAKKIVTESRGDLHVGDTIIVDGSRYLIGAPLRAKGVEFILVNLLTGYTQTIRPSVLMKMPISSVLRQATPGPLVCQHLGPTTTTNVEIAVGMTLASADGDTYRVAEACFGLDAHTGDLLLVQNATGHAFLLAMNYTSPDDYTVVERS